MSESVGVLGGTFDHLHSGHKKLILATASECNHLQIHVVSDNMVKSKNASIQPFQLRLSNLENFIKEERVNASCFVLEDRFGPAISMKECSVIGCTNETVSTCNEINSIREQRGLEPLKIIIVEHVLDEEGEILSSSRIRSGLVDQSGNYWIKDREMHTNFRMPEVLDDELKQPMGVLHKVPEDNTAIAMDSSLNSIADDVPIVAVGDVTVLAMQESGRIPWISVIDGQTQRKEWEKSSQIRTNEFRIINVQNPAGMLTSSMMQGCFEATSNPESVIINVDGEEDLAPIPLILMLPIDCVLMYGQPNEGLVVRTIDINAKHRARRFLDAFIEEATS